MKCKICNENTTVWFKNLFDDRYGYPGHFDILRCKSCGFALTSPQVSKKKIIDLYSKYYPYKSIDIDSVKKKKFNIPKRHTLWLRGKLNGCQYWVKPNSKVLDVGSGLGFHLQELKSIGCDTYGIDPDNNAKEISKILDLKFHQGFIEDKPFKNIKFDYVIANQVLEHTNNPKQFINLCLERLKDDGKLILSFPNTDSIYRKLFGEKWLNWHIPYHLNHFNKKSIMILAKNADININTFKTITPNLWTNIQTRRLFIKPVEGKRDYFWDGGEKRKKQKDPTKNMFILKLFKIAENYNIFNRIIDLLDLGDSFLVILSK